MTEICKHCKEWVERKRHTNDEPWGFAIQWVCPVCGSTIEFYDYNFKGEKILTEVR